MNAAAERGGTLVLVVPRAAPWLVRAIELTGRRWKEVADTPSLWAVDAPAVSHVVIASDRDEEIVEWAQLTRRLFPAAGVLLVSGGLPLKSGALDGQIDDFCLTPVLETEFDARLRRLGPVNTRIESVARYGPVAIDLDRCAASVDGSALSLTFMEYELLRFFVSHPDRTFTRDALLRQVWGYDIGGTRTVDVHVHRLRHKLGPAHAHLFHTVRSVGYRFGLS